MIELKRLIGMVDRFKFTNIWKDGGIEKPVTNDIYKMRKESLRDNMTDIEVLLTDLGEITTCDIT